MPPFRLPDTIDPILRSVHQYWRELRRGGNEMPFWDDLKLSALPEIRDRLMLIDVFERPERFRFGIVGDELVRSYGNELAGQFTNEIEIRPPFDFISAQCGSTAEGRSPTYYERAEGADARKTRSYARLLLPLWGEGSVRMLLGAVAWPGAASPSHGRD